MNTILSLALFVAIALVASRGFSTRVKSRLPLSVLFISGIEFFFLGVILGPGVLHLISQDVLVDLEPVVYLALGWAGLLFGIQLHWPNVRRISRGVIRILVVDAVATSMACSVAFFFLLRWRFPAIAASETLVGAAVLAITASLSSPTIVAVLSRLVHARGHFTNVVKITTALSGAIPLLGFGLLFTVAKPTAVVSQGVLPGALWWIFANGFGITMGFVYTLLTLRKHHRDERLLVTMGTTLFVGGMCYFLQLSALYTSMIMGVVIGNFSRRRIQIFEQLQSFEKPIYITFLILIGARVSFATPGLYVMLAAYVGLRMLLKITVSSLALSGAFPEFRSMRGTSGLALSAQGAMALAIALDYAHGFHGPLVPLVLSIVALSVVVNEVSGVFLTRRALVASGETGTRRARA